MNETGRRLPRSITTHGLLATEMLKLSEAYRVRHGIQGERQFSDNDLTGAAANIADAERELYGEIANDELIGILSPAERELLDQIVPRTMTRFRVTVTMRGRVEQIDTLAASSCDAAVQIIQLLFADSDECATTGFKVKVELVRASTLKMVA